MDQAMSSAKSWLISIAMAVSLVGCGENPRAMTSDHREALAAGCEARRSAGQSVKECERTAITALRARGGAYDFSRLSADERHTIRVMCIPARRQGLLDFDNCLRKQSSELGRTVASPSLAPAIPSKNRMSPAELFEHLAPSVYLVISSKRSVTGEASQGSAVAVTDSLLLTNCHVINANPLVRISDKAGQVGQAEIAIVDEASDRCILRSKTLRLRPIGNLRPPSSLAVGERVYALGNPAGLQHTFTEGLISGLRTRQGTSYVQFSAAITNGSSGGGLFDEQGGLVGITTFVLRAEGQGSLNFAIAAGEFAPQLAELNKRR